MKKLKLKSFNIEQGEDKLEVRYIDLLKSAVNTGKEGGFSPSEMKERLRILEVLDKSKDELKIEDADAKILAGLVKDQKFVIVHQGFVDYAEEVESALS